MQELTFDVPDVSCDHCVNSITKATQAAGVKDVQVDLASKKVYVAFDPSQVNEQTIKAAIEEEGYDVIGQETGRTIAAPKKILELKSHQ